MKKTVYLIVTAMMIGMTTSHAQISVGIKGGLNLDYLTNVGGANTEPKMKLGGHGGVFANIPINDLFGFQPEILFSMKGYKLESSTTVNAIFYTSTIKVKQNATLNYVEIPLQLRVNIKSLYILAGPYLGILASAKSVTNSNGTESKSTSTNGLETLDIGASGGLGIKAENGITGGFKYSRGFTNVISNSSTSNVNSVFQLFVGFAFGGK